MGCVAAQGSVNPFTYTSRYFGTGDGSRTLFNLAGLDSDRAYLMPVLFKQDWGGIQQLYSTARTNLLHYSDQLDISNAIWEHDGTLAVTGNYGTAPDGTMTADRLVKAGGGAYIIQDIPPPVVGTYVESLWIRGNAGAQTISINLQRMGGASPLTSTTVCNVTSEWTRFEVVLNTNADTTFVRVAITSNSTNDFDVLVWRAQFELGSVATAGIQTTTAAVIVTDYSVDTTGKVTTSPALPTGTILSYRDPHAPSGNVYRAFGMGDGVSTDFSLPYVPKVPVLYRTDWQGKQQLYSTARTNYLFQSGNQSDANFGTTNVIVSGPVADPEGGASAYTLTATISDGTLIQGCATGSQTVTGSMWLRRRTGTGSIGLLDAPYSAWTLVTLTSAWQRFSVTAVSPGTAYWGVRIYSSGDAIDVAFGQMEPGSVATSYIPTTTAAVTVTDYTYTPAGDVTLAVAPATWDTSRTNYCFPSENYNNVSWGPQGGIVRVNNAEIVGSLAFTRLSGPSGAACFKGTTFTVDGENSLSLFVKMDGVNSGEFNVIVYDSTAGWVNRLASIITIAANGAVTATTSVGSLESIVYQGDGVYRVALLTTGTISANTQVVYLYDVAGTATIASVLISGVQVSDVLYDYIPTTIAPVTITTVHQPTLTADLNIGATP